MPTYEYACKQCGEHLEVVQSFKDDPLTICPNCKGELRKVFGSIGIVFKGSGFYKTDSRSGDTTTKAPSDTKPDKSDKAESPAASSATATKEKRSEAKASTSASQPSTSASPAPKAAAS